MQHPYFNGNAMWDGFQKCAVSCTVLIPLKVSQVIRSYSQFPFQRFVASQAIYIVSWNRMLTGLSVGSLDVLFFMSEEGDQIPGSPY